MFFCSKLKKKPFQFRHLHVSLETLKNFFAPSRTFNGFKTDWSAGKGEGGGWGPSSCLQQCWRRERLTSNCCRLELSDWGQGRNPTAAPAPNCHWFVSSTIFTVCPLFQDLPSVNRRVWKQWKKISNFKAVAEFFCASFNSFPDSQFPAHIFTAFAYIPAFSHFHYLSCHFHAF